MKSTILAVGTALILLVLPCTATMGGDTVVGIRGGKFTINDRPVYSEIAGVNPNAEGLLIGLRATQALFDDANPATRLLWRYPDGSNYSAERQTEEFVRMLPVYYRYGIRAFTVNLQGDNPRAGTPVRTHDWINSAFTPAGYLKPVYLERLDRIIQAADRLGMVVVLGLFYSGQDQRLRDEAAVKRAVEEVVRYLVESDYRNVLLEINDECNTGYNHKILKQRRVGELIELAQKVSPNHPPVSTSFKAEGLPPDEIIMKVDYIILHEKGRKPRKIKRMIEDTRLKTTRPIIFDRGSTSLKNFQAAFEAGAGWFYTDPGANNYVDGFQSPPTNWRINTAAKKAFFEKAAELIGIKAPGGGEGEPTR